MSRPLPRYHATTTNTEDQRKLDRIINQGGDINTPPPTTSTATLPGDTRKLRGIPVQARGVGGTSPGTDPLTALIHKQRPRQHPRP
jgi:hypothetical protein